MPPDTEERQRWLNERQALQARIRQQKRALRVLHRVYERTKAERDKMMIEGWWRESTIRERCATIAERYWFGRKIAKTIRRGF